MDSAQTPSEKTVQQISLMVQYLGRTIRNCYKIAFHSAQDLFLRMPLKNQEHSGIGTGFWVVLSETKTSSMKSDFGTGPKNRRTIDIMYGTFLKQITDFIFAEHEPEKADIIFIPGNGYPHMAENAARLYREGFAPRILPSGKYSITAGKFSGVLYNRQLYSSSYETEWEFLRDVLLRGSVPEQAILQEDQATYTYENAIFSRKVTDQEGLEIRKAILCCSSFHARRALMYYSLLFPEAEFFVCPSCPDGISRYNWQETEQGIDAVTGEITRLIRQFSLMM